MLSEIIKQTLELRNIARFKTFWKHILYETATGLSCPSKTHKINSLDFETSRNRPFTAVTAPPKVLNQTPSFKISAALCITFTMKIENSQLSFRMEHLRTSKKRFYKLFESGLLTPFHFRMIECATSELLSNKGGLHKPWKPIEMNFSCRRKDVIMHRLIIGHHSSNARIPSYHNHPS